MEGSFSNIFERPETVYDDSLMECMKEEWEELNFYDKEIMTKYWMDEQSLQQIHEYYGITKLSLTRDINRIINKIREKCNNC
jgi:DNA-directed RNA polymerase specialized sigma subunit